MCAPKSKPTARRHIERQSLSTLPPTTGDRDDEAIEVPQAQEAAIATTNKRQSGQVHILPRNVFGHT